MERSLVQALRSLQNTYVCRSCLRHLRNEALSRAKRLGIQNSSRFAVRQQSTKSHIARPGEQASPLYGYYEDVLFQKKTAQEQQAPVSSAAQTVPADPPQSDLPKSEREQILQRARIVFGSRLAGPAERRSEIEKKSIDVAGIMVPPWPEEPDNCCMSGCVNCVWDRYRDEIEEWAAKSALARERVLAQRQKAQPRRDGPLEGSEGIGMMRAQAGMPAHNATSMDDDGGGSKANWNTGLELSGKPGDLFADIPVGIREFMKTEKMLKQRHMHEGKASG